MNPEVTHGPAGLEQFCIRPGLWHIEGYFVHRLARGRWSINRDRYCPYSQPGVLVGSLRQARERIFDRELSF